MITQISGLTGDQPDALRRALADEVTAGTVVVIGSTAKFHMSAAQAVTLVRRAQGLIGDKEGRRGGMYATLHAPLRKLSAIAQATTRENS